MSSKLLNKYTDIKTHSTGISVSVSKTAFPLPGPSPQTQDLLCGKLNQQPEVCVQMRPPGPEYLSPLLGRIVRTLNTMQNTSYSTATPVMLLVLTHKSPDVCPD